MSGTKSAVRWIPLLADGSRRLAVTTTLHRCDHPEVGVIVDWAMDGARDQLIEEILTRITAYVRRTGRALRPGQTMSMTWLPYRFVSPDHSAPHVLTDGLLIEEAANDDGMTEGGFVPSLRSTVSILLAQRAVLDRLGLTARADYPRSQEFATICTQLIREPAAHPAIQGERFEPRKDDCGWMFGCCDADHEHDDSANFAVMHVGHLIRTHPMLLPYLPLPEGTAIRLDAGRLSIFGPGEENAKVEPADALTWRI